MNPQTRHIKQHEPKKLTQKVMKLHMYEIWCLYLIFYCTCE